MVTRRTFLGGLVVASAGQALGQQPPPAGGRPWERDLVIRRSLDGGDSFPGAQLFERASGVPSLVADLRGRLWAAFQWFPSGSPHFDRVAVKWSDDGGWSWSTPVPVVVDGLPAGHQRPFDPTLALLPDGRLRLYFSSSPSGTRFLDGSVGTYSALSEDGVRYVFEPGARFTSEGRPVIDPAAARLGDHWHLTAPIGSPAEGAYHAVSRDGVLFERAPDIPSVGGVNWTGNLITHGRGLRFYGTTGADARGAWWSESADGFTWSDPVHLGFPAGDPGVGDTLDGVRVMVHVS